MKVFYFDCSNVIEKISEHLAMANSILTKDVLEHVETYEGPFCEVIKRNVKVAKEKDLPLCQDTGFVEFFVFIPFNSVFDRPLQDICDEAVRKTYLLKPYRFSLVNDPLYERKNTQDNTPSVCHLFHWNEEKLQVRFLVKGGGSENLSRLFMLPPGSSEDDLVEILVKHVSDHGFNSCPPVRVGVGIGGSSDKAMLLSKLALTYNLNERNSNSRYATLEQRILDELNKLKIGFQGLGVGPTALTVHVLYAPTHIANLPVAVSFDCYLSRKGVVEIEPDAIESR
ncbi:fumarate hydratase [Pseudothermotoga sp.]|nr:fumarate hydratase [Pseudothermotoga sp.]MCX7812911.1 fumarate hydratase [Pseudothermotoga sp.]MDW8139850.1 fumarate hydratase [Pseudothermotoga sp.]